MKLTTKCKATNEVIATKYTRLTEDGYRISTKLYNECSMELKKSFITLKEAIEYKNTMEGYNYLVTQTIIRLLKDVNSKNKVVGYNVLKREFLVLLRAQNVWSIAMYSKYLPSITRKEHIDLMLGFGASHEVLTQEDLSHSTISYYCKLYKDCFAINTNPKIWSLPLGFEKDQKVTYKIQQKKAVA